MFKDVSAHAAQQTVSQIHKDLRCSKSTGRTVARPGGSSGKGRAKSGR